MYTSNQYTKKTKQKKKNYTKQKQKQTNRQTKNIHNTNIL